VTLRIELTPDPLPAEEQTTVTQYWYLTADGARVVPEGHPEGRWLWAAPGQTVPAAEAVRLGALAAGGIVAAGGPATVADADPDEVVLPVKKRGRPADKAVGGGGGK